MWILNSQCSCWHQKHFLKAHSFFFLFIGLLNLLFFRSFENCFLWLNLLRCTFFIWNLPFQEKVVMLARAPSKQSIRYYKRWNHLKHVYVLTRVCVLSTKTFWMETSSTWSVRYSPSASVPFRQLLPTTTLWHSQMHLLVKVFSFFLSFTVSIFLRWKLLKIQMRKN